MLSKAALIALASVAFTTATASAAVVTIDGAPVSGAVVHDGHLMVPFRVPMEQIGATVAWSDAAETGVASVSGHELVRTLIGSNTAFIDSFPKELTAAPVLIDHVEYVPVALLPQISHARISYSDDGTSATVVGFDRAGIDAVGADSASGDAGGRNVYLWVWLLPISAVLCGAAYIILKAQLELDYQRGKRST